MALTLPELKQSLVTLMVKKYSAAHSFSELPEIDLSYRAHLMENIIAAIQRVAVQEEFLAEYPSDWWQAVKQRFAPKWFTKLYPVRTDRLTLEVVYPKIALPREKHVARIQIAKIKPLKWYEVDTYD